MVLERRKLIGLAFLFMLFFTAGLIIAKPGFLQAQFISMVPREITIERPALDTLNTVYEESLPNEYATCIQYDYQKNALVGVQEDVFIGFPQNVSFERCRNFNNAIIHSHPNGVCGLSIKDIFTFGRTFEESAIVLSCIQCGVDKLACFDEDLRLIRVRDGVKDPFKE